LSVLAPAAAVEAALAVTLLAPMPPLMFMGEEWGSVQPFPFFCDFTGDLAEAVRKGRKAEFAEAYAKLSGAWLDPLDEQTFRAAVLDWRALDQADHRRRHDMVRRLLHTRAAEIVPRLDGLRSAGGQVREEAGLLSASWDLARDAHLMLMANLGERPIPRPSTWREGRPIWGGPPPPILQPWSVHWSLA
jgi:1,4-alpha-glucan branching enzyme